MRKQVTGWGNLRAEVSSLRRKVKKLNEMIEYVSSQSEGVTELISGLNMGRRGRTLSLLESENKVVCLTHSIVFRGSSPEDYLVSESQAKIVHINKSWKLEHRCYDSDPTYSTHHEAYFTIACGVCCDVLSHSQVVDTRGTEYSLGVLDKQIPTAFSAFYSTETIDLISEKCFGMVPVTMDNILSL